MHSGLFTFGTHTIRGTSTAGIETSIQVPEWSLCFDIGTCLRTSIRMNRLLLTHAHPDHFGSLISYLGARLLYGMKPADIYVGPESIEKITQFTSLAESLQGYSFGARFIAAIPGHSFPLGGGMTLRPYMGAHCIPTTGYAIWSESKKLKPEYTHLTGPEIVALKQRIGDELTYPVQRLVLAYSGDSFIEILDLHPELLLAQTLLLECSFLDQKKDRTTARAGGHIHLDEIIERADTFRNQHLVLMHFSQIYTPAEVRVILQKRLPDSLKARVYAFTGQGDTIP